MHRIALFPPHSRAVAATVVPAAALLLALTGCLSHSLTRASNSYTDEYSKAANHQLLQNIAELADDQPAYFVQIGSFSTQYSLMMSASPIGSGTVFTKNNGPSTNSIPAGSSSESAVAAATPTSSLALSPSVGASFTETPNFTFTPLAGDAVTKILFAPLSTNILSIVFRSWHADVAMRVAVDSITIIPPKRKPVHSDPVTVAINSPCPTPMEAAPKEAPAENAGFTCTINPTTPTSIGNEPGEAKSCSFAATVTPESDSAKYQWQVSVNNGWDWKNLSDGADEKHEIYYSGTDSARLSIYRGGDARNRILVRCCVTDPKYAITPLVLKNDYKNPSYPLFLALANEVSEAQAAMLIPATYVSDTEKELDDEADAKAEEDAVTLYDIKLADLVTAQTGDYTIKNSKADAASSESKVDQKSARVHAYEVYKNPGAADSTKQFEFPDKAELGSYPLLQYLAANKEKLKISMRSFESALYEAAKEQERFQYLELSPFNFSVSKLLPKDLTMKVTRRDGSDLLHGPSFTIELFKPCECTPSDRFVARPILRLYDYNPDTDIVHLPHEVKLTDNCDTTKRSAKKYLQIGDVLSETNSTGYTPSTSNQNVFAVLSYLYAQASIDSTKLPIQQLVEVR